MRRILAAAMAFVLAGCAAIQTDVHTERGPLLATSQRQSVVAKAGLTAEVETHWPMLTLRFAQFDDCRVETVQTYAEQTITDRTSPAAGPALASGLSTTIAGAGLLAAQSLFSDAPDTGHIDSAGRYGPSDRTYAKNWGVGLVIFGLPSLIVGAVQLARTGETVETRKVDEVATAKHTPCHQQPKDGQVALLGMPRQLPPMPTHAGALTLSAEQLEDNAFEAVSLDGHNVQLGDAATARLDAFFACTQALPPPPVDEALSVTQLQERSQIASQCDQLPEAPARDYEASVKKQLAELEAQQEKKAQAPEVKSFDDALRAYPPQLTLEPGSPDLARLEQTSTLIGTPVLLRGLLESREGQNIVTVRIGEKRVLVFLEPKALWATDFPIGSRIEAVAVVRGTQQLGGLQAPLLRAVWMRTSLAPLSPPASQGPANEAPGSPGR